MPWQNSVFQLLIVAAGAGFSGEFAYAPAPGTGNLIASIAANDGTDPYGNAYVHGVITYATVGGVSVAQGWQDGAVYFASAATQAGPYVVASGALRSLGGGYLNGFHSGNDVNGTQYPAAVTQTDARTIVMAGRLLTPAGFTSGLTFAQIGAPFVLPPGGGTVPEFGTVNAVGGAAGSIVLRPDGNMQVYGNFGGNYTVIAAGAVRW